MVLSPWTKTQNSNTTAGKRGSLSTWLWCSTRRKNMDSCSLTPRESLPASWRGQRMLLAFLLAAAGPQQEKHMKHPSGSWVWDSPVPKHWQRSGRGPEPFSKDHWHNIFMFMDGVYETAPDQERQTRIQDLCLSQSFSSCVTVFLVHLHQDSSPFYSSKDYTTVDIVLHTLTECSALDKEYPTQRNNLLRKNTDITLK